MATLTSSAGFARGTVAGEILRTPVLEAPLAITITGILFFVSATALGAWIEIPIPGTPVPITLQTFFVALSGAVMGKERGTLSQLSYVLLGAAGVPVLAGGAFGLAVLGGPTAGYLLGFLLAPYAVGTLARRAKSWWGMLGAIFCGSAIVLGLGMLRLLATPFTQGSLVTAFAIGVLPFIPGDIIKSSIAATIAWRGRDRFQQLFPAAD